MREFFKSELTTLKIKTNLNQYERLCEMPNAEQELKLLFDLLVETCEKFAYIPDENKKKIIQRGIYSDPDFTGLTPRIVYKWLNAESGRYYQESIYQKPDKIESNARPLSYEEMSPETKKMVNDFLIQLQTPSKFKVPTVTQEELDDIKIEDLEHVEGKKSISAGYKTNPEQIILHDLRIQWMRECTDPLTGKLKEGCLSWEEWSRR